MRMTVQELIDFVEAIPGNPTLPGLANPHSWRGVYSELAFELSTPVTKKQLLRVLKSAIGKTFTGWKGGDFRMYEHTEVHIALEGVYEDKLPMFMFTLGQTVGLSVWKPTE